MRAREIPDSGLRLAILNALIPLGHLDEEGLRERLADIRDPEVESPWEHQDEWISKALERLAEVEIDPTHLAAIDHLDFDGGNDIYMLIEETLDVDTGGETDHYQLGSLAGIERLGRLQTLNLDGHGYRREPLDLGPLRGHPTLRKLVLSGTCIAVEALEHMPALAEVDIALGSVDDGAVLDRLAARGIAVHGRR
ncbi:MAG TPA: hypothetical protein VM869_13500 [Enhygromyxa sp.]|nr:hypothetical protein [Enhygromyxa sp.]